MQIGGSSEWAELAGKLSGVKVSETLLVRSLFWSCGDKAAQVIGSLTEAGTLSRMVPILEPLHWGYLEKIRNENQERHEDVGALPAVCFIL